ncbi:MAG: polysaccharide biosynthesis protein [Sinobacteraceae bacterium]|nr:polysaccharide biosynthesis protein [Nevskiaceae bacterium]
MTRHVLSLTRVTKRIVMMLADMILVATALWSAFALRFDTLMPPVSRSFPVLLAVAVASAIVIFARLGLYRVIVRFLGLRSMYAVAAGVGASVIALAAISRWLPDAELPLSLLLEYWTVAVLLVGGSRLVIRQLFNSQVSEAVERVVIYGAGEAGARLSAALLGSDECRPVAFVDDKQSLQGSFINGIEVFPPQVLPSLVQGRAVSGLLLALPTASRHRKREILNRVEPLGLHVRSLPDISDILAGKAKVDEIREVDVADLLGRDPVPPNPALFDACIRNKVVMVTGAGGSIGSEICRQILRLQPRTLVLFEMSELALYTIDRDLRQKMASDGLSVDIIALLGNAHHRDRVRSVLSAYHVETIYHAAAYKHVPIVEQNVVEGVHNNVISTWYTAEAALDAGVETFVLVSTDKAVNPTNVMGATKRAAEVVLQGLHQRSEKTRFCMVRFGNVLASSGSVVPLFQEQIRRGGPITVTHPDVIRYFMTIPEAAQLVIQAGSMAMGGDVFVLDMGKPVRIDDLARRMIHLMGLTVRDAGNPDGDIEIAYTGLRPAEKLYEELLIGNNVSGTAHPKILRAMEHSLAWSQVEPLLADLLLALRSFDCVSVLELLQELVVEYKPGESLHDLVWNSQRPSVAVDLVASRVVTSLRRARPAS